MCEPKFGGKLGSLVLYVSNVQREGPSSSTPRRSQVSQFYAGHYRHVVGAEIRKVKVIFFLSLEGSSNRKEPVSGNLGNGRTMIRILNS